MSQRSYMSQIYKAFYYVWLNFIFNIICLDRYINFGSRRIYVSIHRNWKINFLGTTKIDVTRIHLESIPGTIILS